MRKLLAAFALVCSLVVAAPNNAQANPTTQNYFITSMNAQRASRNLSPFMENAELSSLAAVWSGQMAANGVISHSTLSSGVTQNWKKLGENVGVGGSVESIDAAFIASPTHLADIIDPAFEYVGVGSTNVNGKIYVVEKFMQLFDVPVAKPVPTTAPTTATTLPNIPPVTIPPLTTSAPVVTTKQPVTPTDTLPSAKILGKPHESLWKLIRYKLIDLFNLLRFRFR